MSITEQYDTYPYPARDPKDERKRLVRGSPSHPVEMDHFLFGGKRNWRAPIRILVAGGGTGDALVQLAQTLTSAKRPYEITYLDLSTTAREIAEARIAERRLSNVTFHTASLLDAPDFGTFDYIDCCGVLHHLPEPDEGFRALSAALSPEGGMGLMVYAPYGRAGVYQLQSAFGTLSQGMSAKDRLKLGKAVLKAVPDAHSFKRNQVLVDHKKSDAGFYDLLLHSQDRPYTVGELAEALRLADLKPAGFLPTAQYDLDRLLPEGVERPDGMDIIAAMDVAEKLRGTIKTHVVYAVPAARDVLHANPKDPWAVPHFKSLAGPQLAGLVAKKGKIVLDFQTETAVLKLPKEAAQIVSLVDGRTPLGALRERTGLDEMLFASLWGRVHDALVPWNELNYSKLLV
ncbi:class I SAM-dependent methyltransferase [Shimia aestuarii]|uniref:Methyltransferase domain-containing protein n=1 Tax=Shimia aestuarii TaxID=254406 RepID=A0A1I4NA66_9RHOB|nr:class I SAM-dependent methyltransferase [Shimia aestuarii]SFM12434.1 Methyltransferase domain-containing protein [Shimia aestuarii]